MTEAPQAAEPAGVRAPSGPWRAPVGTRDVLPSESARWERLIVTFADLVERAGYGLLHGPMFEELGVFLRIGEGTDVVGKEMYDFRDKGDRHVALRPEGTASAARAFVEHRPPTPWKVWYVTPAFRYERPQAGRLRQHHQVGIEAFGATDPDLDVEAMVLLADYFSALGLRQVTLALNSLGSPADRRRYVEVLRSHLRDNLDALADEDRTKVDQHPLRVLDTKRPASEAVVAAAPTILEYLDADSLGHFERVQQGLRACALPFEVDTRLVRGLDYYTHTLFEFRSTALDAAQNAIGGGGRYDGLVGSLGGPDTPAVGFGSGIERVLLTCDAEGVFDAPGRGVDAFVVDVTGGHEALTLTTELRRAGFSVDRAWGGRSMKAQMKVADRSGARFGLIIGADELAAGTVTVRDLRGAAGQRAVPRAALIDQLRALTSTAITDAAPTDDARP